MKPVIIGGGEYIRFTIKEPVNRMYSSEDAVLPIKDAERLAHEILDAIAEHRPLAEAGLVYAFGERRASSDESSG